MSSIPPEPTKAEIDQLRTAALEKIETEGSNFDPVDVKRIRTDDKYIRRFLMHHDNDQKLSLEMVMDTLKWRQEMQCNTIVKESIQADFFDKGAMYIHNRDKDGCKMLVFAVRFHQKGVLDMDQLKKFLIYWLERLEREEQGEWITVFFDMCDTGMKNMDMEFIQYMINLFKNYYPWFLNYIIVFEMPWLLSAMWKIIKTWLPPKSIEKIKFVDKKSLKEFVEPDQALVSWGGTDNYEYQFEAEATNAFVPVANGDIEARKVHFAEGSAQPPASPLRAKPQIRRTISANGKAIIDIDPSEELLFSNCRIGASTSILLTNPTDSPVAFKIKTTSPEKYRVRPSVGVLEGGAQLDISVTVSEQLAPAALVRDKFLVMGAPTTIPDMNSQEVSQLFKNISKDDLFETRLRVGVSAVDSSHDSSLAGGQAAPVTSSELISKIDQLLLRQSAVEEQLRAAKKLVFIMLLAMIVVLVFLITITNNNLHAYTAAMQSANTLISQASHGEQHSQVEL
ncbi:motile sperm domain-containing protein 2-like [Penaeus chinensis]|uniref:motile sperm domain-containing protein 2-like n=1 Tax=Penaeus chinensis TaxID=139456 RepID=UPI001FB78CAD|nr:motile sperm domain-containing protein 2-like [Penaeus chinensis]XP_047475377.1 motile sperm domain-containing protein 2-like [Penaeus chinensis]XP_047475378.1 motile sperm domain-containing protein 2-like [Penaeus chinensis]XP_047475379.1 motile sperm domain-containing protein 2-like [Penaeus chinensis]XP_047475381.1 motile sperm domain-containing protein 2-like [Penaeus chinensis]